MSEVVDGTRDSRGQWQPVERPETAPLWAWPPRPLEVLKWIFGNPGYLWPWTVLYCLLAIATWVYTQPELSRMAEFRLDWIAQIYLRNLALLVLVAGGLHLRLYTFKGQGSKHKYHPKWLGDKNPTFLWGDQLLDNIFWNVASGCTVWTAYEVLMMWAYANGMIPYVDWRAEPVTFAWLACAIVLWHMAHFYFGHRLIHWKPLYRSAHYLHHKNVNVGPWTGLAMHPIEHFIYFSGVLIFWIVPSHPIHAMFLLQLAALSPAPGHARVRSSRREGKGHASGRFLPLPAPPLLRMQLWRPHGSVRSLVRHLPRRLAGNACAHAETVGRKTGRTPRLKKGRDSVAIFLG